MSVNCLILGEPGTGKSTSMRNMVAADTLLIQTIKKPLPFRSTGWAHRTKDNPAGNVFVSDDPAGIVEIMRKTKRKIIVIDDWNLVMTNAFMRRSAEIGFQKFNDIGRAAWDVMMESMALPDDVRVYMLGHTETDDFGKSKAKTIGRMIDEKCPVESLFTIVLRTRVQDGNYEFLTHNSGSDTVKSPLGMFTEHAIENDLSAVDAAICDYYSLPVQAAA
ncbi:MAG TPA: AAA family ATPase [Noviherbaspirillum sp.]|nr:AAA family ATPase [Noviherbaspirillum sp.]